jgi:hypothetical protein
MFAHVKVTNTISQAALTGQRDEALTPDHQSIFPQPLKYNTVQINIQEKVPMWNVQYKALTDRCQWTKRLAA